MHPALSRPALAASYLGTWVVMGALLAALLHGPRTLSWREALELAAPLCLFYAFVCLTPWYTCRALPLTSTNLAVQHLAAAVVACALWIGLARLIAAATGIGPRLNPEIPQLVAMGILLYSLSVALHYTFLAIEASRNAALGARDAELRALKAQINPHFLFNSLNSIAALIGSDPVEAREMCVRLGDFLRKTLGLGERASIAWREELELARAYLDVEHVRFGDRLRVDIDVEEACAECMVPPLVLQPLIENAVRHGIATLVEGGTIRVVGRVREGFLEVSVQNGFDPESPTPRRNGLGLRNVRSRLETRFGGAARLTVVPKENDYRVELVFPCHKA